MVKSLILVEGTDDIKFINLLLKFLEINRKNIVIKQLNNKSNFFKLETYRDNNILASLENEEYDRTLFIFDSDFEDDNKKYGGFKNSEREIKRVIEDIKEELGFDFYTDYYIMCDPNSKNGNLEHLIISTLSTEKQQCVNELLECIKPHKNSGNKKIVLSSYKTIFDEPDYNFSHLNYQNLIPKLISLESRKA